MYFGFILCLCSTGGVGAKDRTHIRLLKMSLFYTLYTGAKIGYFKEPIMSVISREMIISK